jgi:hypothetical protein
VNPRIALHHAAQLSLLQAKRRVLEALLHHPRSKVAQVSSLLGGRAVGFFPCDSGELRVELRGRNGIEVGNVGFDRLSRLAQRSRDVGL